MKFFLLLVCFGICFAQLAERQSIQPITVCTGIYSSTTVGGTAIAYSTKFITLNGIQMDYVEGGSAASTNRLLYLATPPINLYTWRNIYGRLITQGKFYGLDLVGQGPATKPSNATFNYTIAAQADMLDRFVTNFNMTNITLIMHEASSLVGLHWATTHQDKVASLVMIEPYLQICPSTMQATYQCTLDTNIFPADQNDFHNCYHQPNTYGCGFTTAITNGGAWSYMTNGFFLTPPQSVLDKFQSYYLPTSTHAFPIVEHMSNIPALNVTADTYTLYNAYDTALQNWSVPKLMLVASPGYAIFDQRQVDMALSKYPALTVRCIGNALYYHQEDQPVNVARTINLWMDSVGL